jgi:uncharacterized ParB-like nuclease family protein
MSRSASATTATSNKFGAQVDMLVRLVLPADKIEKVDAMMEQCNGREAKSVSTLQTLQEREAQHSGPVLLYTKVRRDHSMPMFSSKLTGPI